MSERVIGDIGSRMLFENDRVRVWELRLEPGARSDVHRHDLDHLLVMVSGGRIAVDPEPDSNGEYRDYFAADTKAGDVVFMKRGGVETAVNEGDTAYHEIVIELKD
jgi:quercetin dioxygenase-like cupin family protein